MTQSTDNNHGTGSADLKTRRSESMSRTKVIGVCVRRESISSSLCNALIEIDKEEAFSSRPQGRESSHDKTLGEIGKIRIIGFA